MNTTFRTTATGLAAVAALALGLGACGGDDDDAADEDASAEGGGGDATTYEVSSIAYDDLTAPAGATIEIDNTSGAAHTFTADDGSFDVEYGSDETATVQAPADAGDYPFHCEIHPSMAATLTVE